MPQVTYKQIQKALIDAGYDVGKAGADGIWGRDSQVACKRFQFSKGLPVDGIPGRDTLTALGLFTAKAPAPKVGGVPLPWYDEGKAHLGLREARGRATNAEIAKWLKELDASWSDDETPWCGAFVGHCIAATLPDEPLPANPFGARNWGKFGVRCDPQVGAVMVFWRKSRQSGLGHVGFYAGEDGANFHVLGGNQSNSVSVAKVSKERFVGARWPKTAPFLETERGAPSDDVTDEGSEA
jgi:uncharacterized protein (TIGR02594 family)